MSENPVQAQVSAVLLYLGYLLIVPGIFGMIHLLRRRAVVLGHVAGALAILGWVTLPGLLVTDFYDLSLAEFSDRQEAIALSDRAGEYAGAPFLGLPVPLGFLGLVLLVVALWRAGFAPVWLPVVLLVGTVVSFFGPPSAVFFTIGTAALLITLGYVGLKILGMSDEEWERGAAPTGGTVGVDAQPRVQ